MTEREWRHPSEDALYEYLDGALAPEERDELERHLGVCEPCTRQLARARRLFARLAQAEVPPLPRDLAADVVAGIRSARVVRAGVGILLSAEAALALVVLVALHRRISPWLDRVGADPLFVAGRQFALELGSQIGSWLAPFLAVLHPDPSRLGSIRLVVPGLRGPMEGWVALVAAAVALGLIGNGLLLRGSPPLAPSPGGKRGDRAGSASRGGRQ